MENKNKVMFSASALNIQLNTLLDAQFITLRHVLSITEFLSKSGELVSENSEDKLESEESQKVMFDAKALNIQLNVLLDAQFITLRHVLSIIEFLSKTGKLVPNVSADKVVSEES